MLTWLNSFLPLEFTEHFICARDIWTHCFDCGTWGLRHGPPSTITSSRGGLCSTGTHGVWTRRKYEQEEPEGGKWMSKNRYVARSHLPPCGMAESAHWPQALQSPWTRFLLPGMTLECTNMDPRAQWTYILYILHKPPLTRACLNLKEPTFGIWPESKQLSLT